MPLERKPTEAKVTLSQFDQILRSLAGRYRIYAPVRFTGRGRFSDSDSIRYAEIQSAYQIESREKSHFSPREVVFPITQTLFHLAESGIQEPAVDERGIIIFLRACDIHALARLDTILLGNGTEKDIYYERLRSKVKFVLMECKQSFENCFCVSMGANRADDYDMAVRFADDGVLAEIRYEPFMDVLPESAEPVDFTPAFVISNETAVNIPEPGRLTKAIRELQFFGHPMWEDYAKRCIACGRCNIHCPTCSCFTTHDVQYEDSPKNGERRRVWASCHTDRFTDMAGEHHFRDDYGSRMRFKTMHKIYDYNQRFGRHMCVGCGRCDDHCPEYISFANCINKINAVLEGEC